MELRKHLKNAGLLSAALGVAAVLVVAARFMSAADIPLPFGLGTLQFPLAGNISQIGIKGGISVKKVTFPTGTDTETLGIDQLYLVVVPNDPAITTQALDDAFLVGQSHSVNYFGYKYTSIDATTEKANKNATLLTDRFPGQFFASAKARAEDSQHGNAISGFEAANGITMADTDSLAGATLEKNSLYFIIVNEPSGASLTIRTTAQATCGDGAISGSETCDDSNTTAGDGCSATCAVESGYECSGTPSTCIPVVCGNGTKEGSEGCDDANTTAGDGCSATCTVESGYTCTGTAPSVCTQNPVCGNNVCEGTENMQDIQCGGSMCANPAYCPADCAVCGNFIREGNEQCDDGNQSNTDSCTNACRNAACGDTFMQGSEVCDDGNTASGDGCSASCATETGFSCTFATPNVCSPVCGDGLIKGSETCDDSNTTAGDGCSATCAVESGYECSGTPSTCTPVVCGNGTKEGSEGCDDANTTAGDGCSATCTVESGYTCTGTAPSVCTQDPVCGNGTKEGSEACDDANTTAGDGCSATCTVESGYTCTGTAPSVCTQDPVCGDGAITGSETCDDSNTTDGDGCSATCAVESGFSCTGIPSECSQIPSNAVAVISQQMAQNATLVGGTQGITLSRFKVIAGVHDVLMHSFKFAIDGNVDNTNSMALWRDTNADGVVDQEMFTPTILNGVASFHDLSPVTSRIVNAGQSVYFELRANVAAQANVPPYISVNFKTDVADVIAVSDAQAQVELSGVSINGVCGGSCDMSLTTVTPTHWEFAPVCGNGFRQGAEACDDGNTTSNDGCSATCALESGYSCTTATPNVCSAVCGDGLIKAAETCDDSNTTAGDGCSASCTVETDYRCTGTPSTCQSYLNYVKALADTNNDGTVSQNEALILTLDVADAPNQPYNTVSQYDMEPDNDVDNTDVSIILAQLDILAP